MALIIRDKSQPPSLAKLDGANLVVPKKFDFPAVCLLTGSTEDLVQVRRKLYWHSPVLYVIIFIGLLFYVLLALILRKQAEITFYISRTEKSRRRKWHLINWGVFLMTFVSCIIAGTTDLTAIFWAAPVFLVATFVIYFLKVRYIYPVRIDDTSVALRGIRPEVMAGLASGMYQTPA